MPTITKRFQHAWNAFFSRDPTEKMPVFEPYVSYGYRPDRKRLTRGNERSIVTAVFNRIAIDVSAVTIQHVRLDENDRFVEEISSGLDYCLTTEANIDQTGRALIQDAVMSMLDEGCVAIVPVDTSIDPIHNGSFDILSLRTGKIVKWMPEHVRVQLYNERTGKRQEVTLPKKMVAIVENPLFAVMNEPNSTLQRLMRKLALMDIVDEESSAGKLDMIIQLPYIIKSERKRQQAEQRRKQIEVQLAGSKYGIAYVDGTERIQQLSKPLENNLLKQVEYLTSMLYGQLGISEDVLKGTADEKQMLTYYNRAIEPILSALTEEMRRKFLTKTARTQRQSILFFRDPFRLVPVNDLADIADRFTRNEILSSNEVRSIIGYKPNDDPRSDELVNKNIRTPEQSDLNGILSEIEGGSAEDDAQALEEEAGTNEQQFDELDSILDSIANGEDEEEIAADNEIEEMLKELERELDEDEDDDKEKK